MFLLTFLFLMHNFAFGEVSSPFQETLKKVSQKENLRMGFAFGKTDLSVLFPKEFPLKFKEEEGKHTYYVKARYEKHTITYQFTCQHEGLESLNSFKTAYLKSINAFMKQISPKAESSILLNEKQPKGQVRVIIDHAGDQEKRLLFVGDFFFIEDKAYLVSEIIELDPMETKNILEFIDESFLNSFERKRK